MSDNTAAASPSGSQPTQKEAFFFLNIMNCMKNKPEVDWDKVAAMSAYANGSCAKTRFRQIKKRLGYTDDGQAAPSAFVAKPRAKKDKAIGSGTNINASKVTKPRAKKEKAVKPEFNPEEEYDVKEHVDAGDPEDGYEAGEEEAESQCGDEMRYFDAVEEHGEQV